ncbi:hypothetical protein GJ496_005426 [Pomphorhynchus laevis]|nr:hypothetical protein GJ496_005426 [Pomphorhynchus laevis]
MDLADEDLNNASKQAILNNARNFIRELDEIVEKRMYLSRNIKTTNQCTLLLGDETLRHIQPNKFDQSKSSATNIFWVDKARLKFIFNFLNEHREFLLENISKILIHTGQADLLIDRSLPSQIYLKMKEIIDFLVEIQPNLMIYISGVLCVDEVSRKLISEANMILTNLANEYKNVYFINHYNIEEHPSGCFDKRGQLQRIRGTYLFVANLKRAMGLKEQRTATTFRMKSSAF